MDKDNSWHLSKTVNISHLLTTVTLVIGMVIYVGAIKTEVAIHQAQIDNMKETMLTNQQSNHQMFDKIDKKLDRLFDLFHSANDKP